MRDTSFVACRLFAAVFAIIIFSLIFAILRGHSQRKRDVQVGVIV
jgi:hypothetical protein